MKPDTPHLPAQETTIEAFSKAISGMEEPCSELHTIADILRSLSENNSGTASSCEVFLMAQILEKRTSVIEALYNQLLTQIENKSAKGLGR